jgi:23S rRNA (cytidine1920-2'-O)/16S rRNA (cytidine1409-2'-O)-methyltransferase
VSGSKPTSAADSGAAFVSRGGVKLAGALADFGIDVRGARALDAGASTGGFTDCLLQCRAATVVAVDVAYGQFSWRLRNDARVRLLERTNVRSLDVETIGGPVDLVVADLSFISLGTVADSLVGLAGPGGRLVLLVKPQFELPKGDVPRGGVVRDPAGWRRAMRAVAEAYRARGWVLVAATPSRLVGPKGNREFFLHMLRRGTDAGDAPFEEAIERAP